MQNSATSAVFISLTLKWDGANLSDRYSSFPMEGTVLPKFIKTAVCATAAVVVTSGMVFSALYAYNKFVTIAADLQKNEEIEAITVVPVTEEPALKQEPVIIVAPKESPAETSGIPQVLERIEIAVSREEPVPQSAAIETLERIVVYALPAANASEEAQNAQDPSVEDLAKKVTDGIPHEAIEHIGKDLTGGGETPNASSPGAPRPQTFATPYFFEEYVLGVNAPSAVLKLRSKKFGDYRKHLSINEFVQAVCAYSPDVMRQINGKGCTIESLSHLLKGTRVRIPATEVFVGVPAAIVEVPTSIALLPKSSEPSGSVLIPSFEVPDPARVAASEAFALSNENAKLKAEARTHTAYLLILGGAAALFFFGSLMLAAKNHKLEMERQEKHEEFIALGKELSDLKLSRGTVYGCKVPDGDPMTPDSPNWNKPVGFRPTGALAPKDPDLDPR